MVMMLGIKIIVILLSIFVTYTTAEIPEISCILDTNSENGSFGYNEKFFSGTTKNRTYNKCYACLYATEANGTWYKSCANSYDPSVYFGSFRMDPFLKKPEFCQSRLKCYFCYTDKCTDNPDIATMSPVSKYDKSKFYCWHGEGQQSNCLFYECSSKKCISFYNFEMAYEATTCYNDSTDFGSIFPRTKNLTGLFYTCDTSECNEGVGVFYFDGDTPFNATLIPLSKTNKPLDGKLSPIRTINHSFSFGTKKMPQIFNITAKIMPNATKFQLIIHPEFRPWPYPVIKLNFNVKKKYISYIDVGDMKEFRRPFNLPSNGLITIIFNGSTVIINEKRAFKLLYDYSKGKMVFNGDWSIIQAYTLFMANFKTYTRRNLTTEQFYPPTNLHNCQLDHRKFKYFTKQLDVFDILSINVTKKPYGIFDVALQEDPCDSSNIFAYFRVSWAPQGFENDIEGKKVLTSLLADKALSNEIIPGFLKITFWTKINGQWINNNVTQLHTTIGDLDLRFDDASIKDYYWKYELGYLMKNNTRIPSYLYVDDPFHVIKRILIT